MKSKTTLSGSKVHDAPSPPKRPAAAFFEYARDFRKDHKGEGSVSTEQVKIHWDKLSAVERKRYDDDFQERLDEYRDDLKKYEEKYGKIEKKKRINIPAPVHGDRPSPPKKPASGYNRFVAKIMQQLKKNGEEASLARVKQLWDKLDEDDKQQYNVPYLKEKEKYYELKDQYEQKYGKIQTKKRKSVKKEISNVEKEKGKNDKAKIISKPKEEKVEKKSPGKGKKVEQQPEKKDPSKAKSKPKKV